MQSYQDHNNGSIIAKINKLYPRDKGKVLQGIKLSSIQMIIPLLNQRERWDIREFITEKFYNNVFLFVGITTLGTLVYSYWLIH